MAYAPSLLLVSGDLLFLEQQHKAFARKLGWPESTLAVVQRADLRQPVWRSTIHQPLDLGFGSGGNGCADVL